MADDSGDDETPFQRARKLIQRRIDSSSPSAASPTVLQNASQSEANPETIPSAAGSDPFGDGDSDSACGEVLVQNPFSPTSEQQDPFADTSVSTSVADLSNDEKPSLPPRPSSLVVLGALEDGSVKPPLPARPKFSETLYSQSPRSLTSLPRAEKMLAPENANANRRPPRSTLCPQPIQGRLGRCLAIGRGYLCIGSSANIRIWNGFTGECSHTIPTHKAETKIAAMAFVPALSKSHDSKYLWVSFNDGDIVMINIFTGQVLERRLSAHSHAVVHILRHRHHMWTLDDNGVLQIWHEILSDVDSNDGRSYRGHIVSLDSRPKTLRIGAKQQCAAVVDGCLWTVREKVIEIVAPYDDVACQKTRIEIPGYVGSVSCIVGQSLQLCPLNSKCTASAVSFWRVFTGHVDGKIVEWDAGAFTKRRIIDMGSYRIVSLVSVTDRLLWIAFGTGKIDVLDLGNFEDHSSSSSVITVKSWQVHEGESLEAVSLDADSIIHCGELHVGTMTKTGLLHLWDAILPHDFLDMELKRRESRYCARRDIEVFIGSWNIDACKPVDLPDARFVEKWVSSAPNAGIVVIGLQEIIDLESKKLAAKGLFKSAAKKDSNQAHPELASRATFWKERLCRAVKGSFERPFRLVESRELVGLLTCIFVREDLVDHLSHVAAYTISTGLGGVYGNKGAIICRFGLFDSSLCFITSHLPAHQDKVGKRNVDAFTIIRSSEFPSVDNHLLFVCGGDGRHILDHESCFFFGDLNYRIDLERSQVERLIAVQDWDALWPFDQLFRQRQNSTQTCLLRVFDEAPLAFAPTYKYDPGTDRYDTSEKQRTPSWCDRILFRDGASQCHKAVVDSDMRELTQSPDGSLVGGRLTQTAYRRFECTASDHKPIGATFNVSVKSIDGEKLEQERQRIKSDFDQRFRVYSNFAMAEWIAARIGRIDTTSRDDLCAVLRLNNYDLDASLSAALKSFSYSTQ